MQELQILQLLLKAGRGVQRVFRGEAGNDRNPGFAAAWQRGHATLNEPVGELFDL